MENEKLRPVPAIVMRSIGGGLLLMTLFTMMWAGIAYGHSQRVKVLIIFGLFSLSFLIFGIKFLIGSKNFPTMTTEADKLRGKDMRRKFGIIFGIEGLAIPIACGTLVALGLENYILPAIALIVGLHFYPMASLFDRVIDRYIATWTCLQALFAIFSISRQPSHLTEHIALLGVGVAIATTVYGCVMIRQGWKYSKNPFFETKRSTR